MRSRLSSIGERVYELNKEALEREYMGKIVALCEKGVAGVGDTLEEVYKEARRKYPKEVFYFRRVGPCPAGYLFLL
ncbi:MAG: DUF5678 domain-containing protein [Nitrososphaerales archaeon]